MPIESRWNLDIPEVSLPTWVFGPPSAKLSDRPIFIDASQPEKRLSLAEYRTLSKRIAIGLQKAHLQPGDRVLLYSGNKLHFAPIFMGVVMAGGIFTGCSPAFGVAEVSRQIKDCGATFVICQREVLKIGLEGAKSAGLPSSRVYMFDDDLNGDKSQTLHSGVHHWTQLLANEGEAENFQWFEPSDAKTTTCCLNYSSGTTGMPKGVEITHYSYVGNGVGMAHLKRSFLQTKGQSIEELRTLCFMPLYHAAAQTGFLANSPHLGLTTYIMPMYEFEALLRYVQTYKITDLVAAPPMLVTLAKSPLRHKYDLSSIRDLLCGTAPLAPEVSDEVEKLLWPNGDGFIQNGWGMTELTCVGSIWDKHDTNKSKAVGETAPNGKVRLIDDAGNEVTTANTRGELYFSGPTVMKGYWKKPQATEETVTIGPDGTRWLRTGDIAFVDKYGPGAKIFIVDRVKELIKVRGFQVSPAELEATLLERPDVADAGVVGVEINGEEVPRAYIVRTSGVSAEEIATWMQGKVAKYKWLRGGVVFVDEIPKIPVRFYPGRVTRAGAN